MAKKGSEKFYRVKCSTLIKMMNGFNPAESVYDWKGQEGQEEFKVSDMNNDNESVYSMISDNKSQMSTVTVTTN